jgi:hypothetical protein
MRTHATSRRPSLNRAERRYLCAVAAQVCPAALRFASRLDPAMSPAKGSVADKLRKLAAAAIQTEMRLLPTRELRGLYQRVNAA